MGTQNIKPENRLVTATAAKTGSTTTAVVDGTTTVIQVARDLTVAAGDVLFVSRYGSQWFAVARGFAGAPGAQENDTAPDPKPLVVTGNLVVAPVETRSYRSGAWRTDNDDVYEGQYGGNGNHTGAVFYGSKPRSLAGATVLAASVRVRRSGGGGAYSAQPTIMRLMTQATRPGGAPTLGASTAGPSLKRGELASAFPVPDSWAQAMIDGTAGGLAFYDADGSPYVIMDGRGSYGPAFTLSIKWMRS